MLDVKKKKLEAEKQKKREERKLMRQSMRVQNTNMFDMFRRPMEGDNVEGGGRMDAAENRSQNEDDLSVSKSLHSEEEGSHEEVRENGVKPMPITSPSGMIARSEEVVIQVDMSRPNQSQPNMYVPPVTSLF